METRLMTDICVDCKTETDKPYCCGNWERRCQKCAEDRFQKGIKNGIITLGIVPITAGNKEYPHISKAHSDDNS